MSQFKICFKNFLDIAERRRGREREKMNENIKMSSKLNIFFSLKILGFSLKFIISNRIFWTQIWTTFKTFEQEIQTTWCCVCVRLLFFVLIKLSLNFLLIYYSPFASFASRLSAACTSTFSTITLGFSSAAACNKR